MNAIDIKEYPVKGSEGDKIRIIFTIKRLEEAIKCFRLVS